MNRASPATARHPGQLVAAAAGVVFLVVGVAGFVPGLTTNFDELRFAGHESEALLLGLFQVSVLHNIVHLLFGVAGLAMARSLQAARAYLLGGGVVYLLLWLYGLFISAESDANFVPLNSADNWLHLGLAIVMLALGMLVAARRSTRA